MWIMVSLHCPLPSYLSAEHSFPKLMRHCPLEGSAENSTRSPEMEVRIMQRHSCL